MRTEITVRIKGKVYHRKACDHKCDCTRQAVAFLGDQPVCQFCIDCNAINYTTGVLKAERLACASAQGEKGVLLR